jgi:glycerol dehydrogenase-like iron-containing ADH family enzyme
MTAETELEMVRRHVRQGAEHVANQRALIARLSAYGLPTEAAEAILANFEDLQHQHEAHLARAEGRLVSPTPGYQPSDFDH